jgi:hypothetical protein
VASAVLMYMAAFAVRTLLLMLLLVQEQGVVG